MLYLLNIIENKHNVLCNITGLLIFNRLERFSDLNID